MLQFRVLELILSLSGHFRQHTPWSVGRYYQHLDTQLSSTWLWADINRNYNTFFGHGQILLENALYSSWQIVYFLKCLSLFRQTFRGMRSTQKVVPFATRSLRYLILFTFRNSYIPIWMFQLKGNSSKGINLGFSQQSHEVPSHSVMITMNIFLLFI